MVDLVTLYPMGFNPPDDGYMTYLDSCDVEYRLEFQDELGVVQMERRASDQDGALAILGSIERHQQPYDSIYLTVFVNGTDMFWADSRSVESMEIELRHADKAVSDYIREDYSSERDWDSYNER